MKSWTLLVTDHRSGTGKKGNARGENLDPPLNRINHQITVTSGHGDLKGWKFLFVLLNQWRFPSFFLVLISNTQSIWCLVTTQERARAYSETSTFILFLITLFTLCTKVEKQSINLELNFIPTKIYLLFCKGHWWKTWTKLFLHCPFNCPQRQHFKNDSWAQDQHSHVLPHHSTWMSHGVELLVKEFFSNPLDLRKTRNWKHMDKGRECYPQGFYIINYEYLGA